MRIGIAYNHPREAEILSEIIASQPGYDVVWIARDGRETIRKTETDSPDLLLMGLVLPDLGGAEATRIIMKGHPCAILIVSPSVSENAAQVFEAMGNGALDVVGVPTFDEKGRIKGKEELLKKIATIEKLIRKEEGLPNGLPRSVKDSGGARKPLIAIGSSTGGPKALGQILSALPGRLGAPVVIVQHLEAQFAGGLVEWLGQQTRLKVVLAEAHMKLEPDTVFVAGTNDHLVLGPEQALHYVADPVDYPFRPSVDRFFLSARDYWPGKGVAVLLTGMGRDGAKGLLALRRAGWHTIAQDEKTSVVYGMPKAAMELEAAVKIMAVEKIADEIIAQIRMKEGLPIYDNER